MLRFLTTCLIGGGVLLFSACQGDAEKKDPVTQDITQFNDDNSASGVIELNGELFSIPSPIQSAIFIKENGSGYREDLLLEANKLDAYQTSSQKAIALGLYGAELGYVSLYDENDRSLSYMNTTRKLADDIGISGAFSEGLVRRFTDNVGQADSMVVLVSDIYSAADAYLKSNERNDMATLILFGGWVESLFIVTEEARGGSPVIYKRISEEKAGFDRLYSLMGKYTENGAVNELQPSMDALKKAFDMVESKYVYKRPEVQLADQKTLLKGEVLFNMEEGAMTEIISAVQGLRNQIIGTK